MNKEYYVSVQKDGEFITYTFFDLTDRDLFINQLDQANLEYIIHA